MINFKDFKDLSLDDQDCITYYVDLMSNNVPIIDVCDYLVIKKYIRKILEIIKKGEHNDNR